jgi:hypothetical protein
MSATTRWAVFIVALCVAILAFTVSGANAEETLSPDLQVCSADEPRELTDENARWRLRAYRNLDCLVAKLEQAMNRPAGTGKNTVTLAREEAEQLRTLAWLARDAAARIGR